MDKEKRKARAKKPTLLITWDTETFRTLDPDGSTLVRPYLIGWWCEGQFFYSFRPHNFFFDFLREKCKTYTLHLWAHNANYDLSVIYPEYLSKYIENHKITWKVSEAKKFISFQYSSRGLRFKVFDTSIWNPHRLSLADWLKVIGKLQKIEGFNYDKWDLKYLPDFFSFKNSEGDELTSDIKEELEYLKRDVEGLAAVIAHQEDSKKYLFDLFQLEYPTTWPKTAPSFGKRLINCIRAGDFFNQTYKPLTMDENLYRSQLASSCGGFTACNLKQLQYYSKNALIKSYDINSCYPYILAEGIPSGEISPENIWPQSVTWYECEMSECEWIEAFSFISTLPIPKRWTQLDHTFFLLKEYFDVIKNYIKSDLKIVATWFQPLNFEMSSTVKRLYKEKVSIDKEPDSFEKTFKKDNIKLLLNSLYGKLAEKTYMDETSYNQKIFNFESVPVPVDEFGYTLSGVYVVQKARAYLISTIIKEIEQGNIFLYADTDSIKLVEFKPVLFKVDPFMLGAFKSENFEFNEGYTHFYSTGKIKKYLIYHETKYKLKNGLKMALSGISVKVQKNLLNFAPLVLLKILFDPSHNVCIVKGKLSNKRNKWGQVALMPLDICLNGNSNAITLKIEFDENHQTWHQVKKSEW